MSYVPITWFPWFDNKVPFVDANKIKWTALFKDETHYVYFDEEQRDYLESIRISENEIKYQDHILKFIRLEYNR